MPEDVQSGREADRASDRRIRLFSGPLSMFGAKVQIALHEKNVDFELVMVPFTVKEGYAPKHPEVLRINPKRQVPVLIDGGLEIFDSTQIFEYLEDIEPHPALWPATPAARAWSRRLEHESDEVYFPHIIKLMQLWKAPDDPAAEVARAGAAAYYRTMEAVLGDREFLGGEYSFADIAFYMAQLFGVRMGADMTDEMPKLLQWRQRMTARPAVIKVVGPMADYLRSQGLSVPAFLLQKTA
ncbi:glutathione S-transferase family protein [Bradyrhizobium archetypum]|uniref:Glutathione S-transferase family protein n=1 Tax=Bradyrhizobium archetypum TaxID=2721160 RepID=A0A7Y4H418_9BRAD|nr:glutathione S-transferase family protein [Bradyrhizobium archetypum]NOJ47003.1 glutathione S-transferase family protein [Bradyrhizobium archetypum]